MARLEPCIEGDHHDLYHLSDLPFFSFFVLLVVTQLFKHLFNLPKVVVTPIVPIVVTQVNLDQLHLKLNLFGRI